MRDLMAAKQFSSFARPRSDLTGVTDANHGFTPFTHASHDLGMAMDLGISQYISDQRFVTDAVSQVVQQAQLANPGQWSNADPTALLQALADPSVSLSGRHLDWALQDFLSLYSVTQKGSTGSRDALKQQVHGSGNQDAVLNALFGDGTQIGGLINGVLIGGTSGKQNTYPDIREALSKLGFIKDATSQVLSPTVGAMPTVDNVAPHNDHFHIYLQPPEFKAIQPTNFLVANTNGTSSPSVGEAQAITEEIIREIESRRFCAGSENPSFAIENPHLGILNPSYGVLVELIHRHGVSIQGSVSTILDARPENGFVQKIESNNKIFPGLTIDVFSYTPKPGFLGEDHVLFKVLVGSQVFTINYLVRVVETPEFNDACEDGTIKEEDYLEGRRPLVDVRLATIEAAPASAFFETPMPGFQWHFDGFPGTALGRTEGGSNPAVVLDTDAAGHGWFIDATPDSSEEFLPTADPNLFIAKPGSAAEGKMDMLSVPLHEYGHALGLGVYGATREWNGATAFAALRWHAWQGPHSLAR